MRISEELLKEWLDWYEADQVTPTPIGDLVERTQIFTVVRNNLGDSKDAVKDDVARAAFESVRMARQRVLGNE